MRKALIVGLLFFPGVVMAQQSQGFQSPPRAAQLQPASAAPVSAVEEKKPENSSVELKKSGKVGHEVFIGSYITVDRSCKVGATPKVEFPANPSAGKVRTRRDAVNLTQAPGIPRNKCLGVSPAGIAVMYRPNPKTKGDDAFTYLVTYPDGHTREVKVTVSIQ